MNNLKFKTNAGIEVELDDMDMHRIHQYYKTQCLADYLRENHTDWNEDKVQKIACETYRLILNDFEEDAAIKKAIGWYEYYEEHLDENMEGN